MIDAYVEALIHQTLERAKVLRGKIRNPSPTAEFSALQSRCEYRLDEAVQRLTYLRDDMDIKRQENVRIRMRLLRRAIEDMAQLEYTGIAALNRPTADDVMLNKLVFAAHQEISYPLTVPAVTCLSQSYYVVYPSIGLMAVPLAEPDFLLHLPDLYHELAHPIIAASGDPRAERFQTELAKFNSVVSTTFAQRMTEIARQTGPRDYLTFESNLLEHLWIKYWSVELFCDLFAAYTLGPAYAWSHLHLTASRDADPYSVKIGHMPSHPPDQARMEVMLHALSLLSYNKEAGRIRDRWNELLRTVGSKQESMYRKACPRELLEQAAAYALEGTKAIGCRLADGKADGEIHVLLNEAWQVFWQAPIKYLDWEKTKVKELREKYKA